MTNDEQPSENKTPTAETVRRRKSSRAVPGEKFDDYIMRRKEQFEQEHKSISIWTSPLLVISYFIMYSFYEVRSLVQYGYQRSRVTWAVLFVILGMFMTCQVEGPHQETVRWVESQVRWYGYWTLLGVASSVGLGSGLHTFVLFLGPYIAEVTLAAYDCGAVGNLQRNTQSYRLACPTSVSVSTSASALASASASASALASAKTVIGTVGGLSSIEGSHSGHTLSLWPIYQCIAMETLAWGVGTALGELPPYFMARAVALSGGKNEELKEFESGLAKSCQERTLKESVTFYLYLGMKRLGFFGILLFASIPNPLFDLAGITCGHFLVPFTTFFGATLFGKACIKASIQALIVILAFSHDTLSVFLITLESSVPTLHKLVSRFITDQTRQLGKSINENGYGNGNDQVNYFGLAWNSFLSLMIGYFVISSIESLGLAFMKRQHEEELGHLKSNQNKRRIPS